VSNRSCSENGNHYFMSCILGFGGGGGGKSCGFEIIEQTGFSEFLC
jgi:hypothetical protein